MKKLLSFVLVLSMTVSLSLPPVTLAESVVYSELISSLDSDLSGLVETNLDDNRFSSLAANELYLDIGEQLVKDGYGDSEIQVDVTYYPKEYIKALTSNSKENIYFGYKLSELNELYVGKRYYFTCDDSGDTIVKEFELYEDNLYMQALQNVAVGTGIIIISVTITLATGGFGAPVVAGSAVSAINIIFSSAATSAAVSAISGGAISSVVAGATVAFQKNDWEEIQKATILAGSEGFLWGAIIGTGTGMFSGAVQYGKALKAAKALPKTKIDDVLRHTPSNNGKWADGTRGNGKFISDDPVTQRILSEKGVDGIIYNNGVPDFSSVADDMVEISGKYLDALQNPNSSQVRRAMQREARELLAIKRNVSVNDIKAWMNANGLTIHEDINMTSLYFVKEDINKTFMHLGGVSEYMTRIGQGLM